MGKLVEVVLRVLLGGGLASLGALGGNSIATIIDGLTPLPRALDLGIEIVLTALGFIGGFVVAFPPRRPAS